MYNPQIKKTVFWVTVLGTFLAVYDSTGVNIALYKIATDFNTSISLTTWIIVAYMLTLTTLLPLFGKLGDVLPKNILYSSGFALFGTGAVMSALSSNLSFLIFSRCVEAVGASVIFANAPALIATIFKGSERGKALGLNGAVIALAGMISPTLSGIIMNFSVWNLIFIPAVIFAVLGCILSFKYIPYNHSTKTFKFDFGGFIYFSMFLSTFLLILFQGHLWGWTSKPIIACWLICFVSFLLFFKIERKFVQPIIDFSLFKNKSFSLTNTSLILSYLPLCGNGIIYPLYAQYILGFSPLVTGLSMLPFSVALVITAPISGTLAGKYGSRYLTVSGAILMGCAVGLFSEFDSLTGMYIIIIAQTMMGVANGLFQSPTNNAVFSYVKQKQIGSASGILGLARNTGMVTGTSIAISLLDIFKHSYSNSINDPLAFMFGYKNSLHILIIFAIICASTAFFAHSPKLQARR